MKKIFTIVLAVFALLTMPAHADSYACGENSYDPQTGAFDPADYALFEFVDGGKYALVFHKDKDGSYVLAPKDGEVKEGAKLVVRLYKEGDESMLFTMHDAGDGCFFLKSAVNADLAVTGGGNMSEASLQEYENVSNIDEQKWALAECDKCEFVDGDAGYTMFNVRFGTGMDTDNQLVEENWKVIFWKNFGAWHPVDMADPDYDFKGEKQYALPLNATFNKTNLDTSKKYAFVWRWSIEKEPTYTYADGTITGRMMRVTESGATIDDFVKEDQYLFYAEKVGDFFKFKNVATGKVMYSGGVNMSGVALGDEATLQNPDEALWDIKDIKNEKVFGLAFNTANKAGLGGIDVANQQTANGTQVLIWSVGREWFIFDVNATTNPFVAELPSSLDKVKENVNYATYSNGIITVLNPLVKAISIINLSGAKVKSESLTESTINVSNLAKGMYIVTFADVDGGNLGAQKIIID